MNCHAQVVLNTDNYIFDMPVIYARTLQTQANHMDILLLFVSLDVSFEGELLPSDLRQTGEAVRQGS